MADPTDAETLERLTFAHSAITLAFRDLLDASEGLSETERDGLHTGILAAAAVFAEVLVIAAREVGATRLEETTRKNVIEGEAHAHFMSVADTCARARWDEIGDET